MKASLIKAAIAGGIVAFLWGVVSYMVLPWHMMTMHPFKDEEAVSKVIAEHVEGSGVYILPFHGCKEREDKPGPFVFATVDLKGMCGSSMAVPLARSLIIQIVAAFFITWMLTKTKGLKHMEKAGFAAMAGLFAGFVGLLPGWNWVAFPLGYTLIGMLDLVIAWFLAGLTISKIAKLAK
jgi:hypothetical protein